MTALSFMHLLILAVFMGFLVAAAIGDFKNYRIPNTYCLALLALYPLFAYSAPYPVQPIASIGISAVVLGLSFVAFARGLVGGGDAKLISAAALYAGPGLIFEFLMVTAIAGAFVALFLIMRPVRFAIAVAADQWGQHALRNALLAQVIPYAMAIAAGGIYLTLRLAVLAGAA